MTSVIGPAASRGKLSVAKIALLEKRLRGEIERLLGKRTDHISAGGACAALFCATSFVVSRPARARQSFLQHSGRILAERRARCRGAGAQPKRDLASA